MDIKVSFTPEAYDKMFNYIHAIDAEISGFGKIERISNNEIKIVDIKIFKQTVSSSETEIDEEDISSFLIELMNNNENPEDWKVWWHSHHTMDVFWSGTDVATINKLVASMGWVLSVVGNKRDLLKCRLDIKEPFKMHKDDIPIVKPTFIRIIPEDIKEEVKEKVTEKAYTYTSSGFYIGNAEIYGFARGNEDYNKYARRSSSYVKPKETKLIKVPKTLVNDTNDINEINEKYHNKLIYVDGFVTKYSIIISKWLVLTYCNAFNLAKPAAGTESFNRILKAAIEHYSNPLLSEKESYIYE